MQAQVANYTFASSAGTYTAISGGTVLGNTSSDEQVFNNSTAGASGPVSSTGFPIGFNFTYRGITYDKFAVAYNGHIVLGTGTFSANSALGASLSSSSPGLVSVIAPFNTDLQGQTNSELSYLTTGSAGSRILTVQWKGVKRFNNTSNVNFQVQLFEGTNVINFVYGSCTTSTTPTSAPQVGLRGADNSDVHARSTTSNWSSTTLGTNASTCSFSATVAPTNGLTFTFTPPGPCTAPITQPTALTFPTVTSTSLGGSFTAASGSPSGYLVVRYAAGATPTAPSNGTTYSTGNALGTGTVVAASGSTTFTASSLTANTAYDFYIYSYTSGSCSIAYNTTAPLFLSKSTCLAPPTVAAASNIGSNSIVANWAAVAGATGYQLDVSTSSGFGTFVTNYNSASIAAGNTSATVSGLSPLTTYYYRVRAVGSGCTSGNSSTTTVISATALPWTETFGTASSMPTGWTNTSSWTIGTSRNGAGNSSVYLNLYSSVTSGSFNTPTIGLLPAVSSLSYQYTVTDFNTAAAVAAGWGSFQLQVSTNGGTTWTNLGAAVTGVSGTPPNGYVTVTQDLTPYSGQGVAFKIVATWTTGDYYLNFDNFTILQPCATPSAPTALAFGATGPGSIAGSFTASSPAPTGYMIVRYPAGATPVAPTNASNYTVGQSMGTGVVSNITATTSFTATGLSPNTSYDFYVYPYNNTSCLSGPAFGTALSGTQSTSGCPTLNAAITVGATGDYTRLADLALILNGCPVSQPTIIKIKADYSNAGDTYPVVFSANSGATATNTITIRPDDAVASMITLTASSTSPLIDLSGAKYMVIDGRPGSTGTTSYLTISNTGDGAAVRLFNDAQNNTITYTTLKAANTSSTNGVIRITSAAGSTLSNGNNNNVISFNNIDGNGTSPNGIYASGSAAPADNKSITISNNNIFNYYSDVAGIRNAGIQFGGGNAASAGSAWTISGNSFYQTASRSFANAVSGVHAINMDGGDAVATITGNYIGGTQPSCGGTALTMTGAGAYAFSGMRLFPGSVEQSNITNNTIQNIGVTTASTSNLLNSGMAVNSGMVNVSNNTVGSATTAGSIAFNGGSGSGFNGILAFNGASTTGQNVTISGNTIAGIAVGGSNAALLNGISILSATTLTGTHSVSNNTIGTQAAPMTNSTNSTIIGISKSNAATMSFNGNTISYLTSTSTGSSAQVVGISVSAGANTIGTAASGNTVRNLTAAGSNTSTTSGASVIGISMTSTTAGQSVAGNTIATLVNSSNSAVTVSGMSFTGSTTGTNSVSRNLVYGVAVTGTSTSSLVHGIQVSAGTTTFDNNVVRLGMTNATLANVIAGVTETSGTNNWYYNSIYVGGTNVGTATSNTFAFNSTNTGTRVIQNNVFQNARTNATTGGKHYAITVAGSTSSPSGLTLSNNVYYADAASGGFVARYNSTDVATLAAWKTTPYASGNGPGLDAGSWSGNPNFNNPTAAVPDLSVNVALPSLMESQATPIASVTTDFVGATRNATTPDIGAYEFAGSPASPSITINSITPGGTQCAATSHVVSATVTPGATPITNGMVTITYAFNGGTPVTTAMTNAGGNTWTYSIPAATPGNATVTYSVTANDGQFSTNRAGTAYSDEPLLGVALTATSNFVSVCAGNSATLSVAPNGGPVTIGAGSSVTGSTTYPTLYGYRWFQDWQQYLYRASELTAAGVKAGMITKIGFTVSALGDGAPTSYTIRIAGTSNTTTSSTFVTTGLTTVYGPVTATPATGLNEFTLTTPFAWNGTDNLIIDIRGTGGDLTNNATVVYTTTAYNSVVEAHSSSNNASYYTSAPSGTTNTTRPNLKITVAPALTYAWSDGTSNVGSGSSITIPVSATTTYTATGTDANNCTVTSNSVTVTVTALSVAATPSAATVCAGSNVTLTANVAGGGQPYASYTWKNGAGTTIASTANTTFAPAQADTYTLTVVDACGNSLTSAPVSVGYTALPVVALNLSGAQTICAANQQLTATHNAASPAYQWLLNGSNIAAGSGGTAATYTASANGIYSLKVTDGGTGCANTTATTTLSFAPYPSALTVTPASATNICLGASQTITASGTVNNAATVTVFSENFNSGLGSWALVNAAGSPSAGNWAVRTAPYTGITGGDSFTGFSIEGGKFVSTDADAGGSGTTTDSKLQSPAFSTLGYGSATLRFQHIYQRYSSGSETVLVEASSDGGSVWTSLKTYSSTQGTITEDAQAATQESINLPAGFLNKPDVRIRFSYKSTFGYYWMLDNVQVQGVPNAPLFTWSSPSGTAGLPVAATTASAVNNSISVTPSAAGSYTYTVVGSVPGSSCTTTNSVTLNTVTPSTAPSTLNASASGTLCPGTNVILTQTGGSLGQGAYWQWYKDAAFTQTVGGQLSSSNAQLTVSPGTTTSYYLRAEGGSAPCAAIVAAASPVTITVYAASVSGTVSSNQSLCSGSTPASLTLAGSNGSIQWQSATDAAFTQNVVNYGSSTASLTGAEIGALTQSTYVRAVVTNGTGCASATSNSILITVNSYPAQQSVQGSATYCDGVGSVVTLSGSEAGSSYQLVKNGSNLGSPMAGTGSALNFGIQGAGTYTVVATNASNCSIAMTGSAVLTAVGPFTAQISAQNSILCSAGNFTTIYVTNGPANGNVTITTNGTNPQTYALNASGAYSFQTGVLNANALYTITSVSNGSCATATSISTAVYVGALIADALPNQSLCAGTPSAPIAFTGNFPAGTTYSWTSSNAAIGLSSSSGSGVSLPSFIPVNATSDVVYTDISVVPNLSIEGCEVRHMVFRVAVKPQPTVNATGNQSLCAGSLTAAVNFSGNLAGTTYSWTNSNPAIGLAAQGTGSIPSFTAVNNSNQSSVSGTITVTPRNSSCNGASATFTITVNKASATVTYPNSPYCPTGPAMPRVTGSTGGTFSAPAGVVFNSVNTGEINLANSQPGTYTVTYTIVGAAGGCGGTTTAQVTILPRATINSLPNQAVCANSITTMVQPAGTASNYSWVNLNPAVGLSATGTGTIPAFTALNSTNDVVTAQVNVTPLGNGTTTCTGNAVAFRYTIYPRPAVNPVNNGNPYIYCRNTLSSPVTFTSATPNTSFGWTNDNTTVGLAGRGTGSIGSFTATNPLSGAASIATVTVTPMANKCAGTPYQFVIEVDDCITQSGNTGGDGSTARMAAQVVVGPNPTTNRVTVYYRGTEEGPFTVQLLTQYGQAITKPATFTGTSYTLDLTGMTPGAYVLQLVNTRTKTTVQKQVIKL